MNKNYSSIIIFVLSLVGIIGMASLSVHLRQERIENNLRESSEKTSNIANKRLSYLFEIESILWKELYRHHSNNQMNELSGEQLQEISNALEALSDSHLNIFMVEEYKKYHRHVFEEVFGVYTSLNQFVNLHIELRSNSSNSNEHKIYFQEEIESTAKVIVRHFEILNGYGWKQ